MLEVTSTPTEYLPDLYRTILSLVGELERRDGREEAGRIRKEALAAYGSAWDDRQGRRLVRLEHQLRRSIASHHQPVRWSARLP